MVWTLSEKIVNAVGTGEDPAELDNLELQSAVLQDLTATAAELNYNDITTLGTGAASKAVVLDASGDYTFPATATIVMPSSGTTTYASGSTLTMAGTLAVTGTVTNAPIIIADATPYTVLAANSGRVHVISEQTSTITLNLPVQATGLYYEFIMGGVATEAQNYVFVATTPSFLNGGIHWADLDSVASNTAVIYGNGTSHLTLTCVTPAVGTVVRFFGTTGGEWLVSATVVSNTTPTIT